MASLTIPTSWGDQLLISPSKSQASLYSSSSVLLQSNIPIYGLSKTTDFTLFSRLSTSLLKLRFQLTSHLGQLVLLYSEGLKAGGANCSKCCVYEKGPRIESEGPELNTKLQDSNINPAVIRVPNHNGMFDEIAFIREPNEIETPNLTKRDGLSEEVKDGVNSSSYTMSDDILVTPRFSLCNLYYAIKPVQSYNNSKPLIALTSLQIYADIQKFIADVTIVQNFINTQRCSLECEYILPYDNSIVISDILIHLQDGRQITFDIQRVSTKKPDSSVEDYRMYGKRGDSPCMVLSLGSIPPKSKLAVHIKYLTTLRSSNQLWEFSLPSTLTPRYFTKTPFINDSCRDFHHLKVSDCSYTIGIRISIHNNIPILNLTSPSHFINSELTDSNKTAFIYLSSAHEFTPEKDFILQFFTADMHVPRGVVQVVNHSYIGMFSFIPRFLENGECPEDIEGCGDFIFLLDRSASMRGAKMKMAKDTVQLFLNSLPARCKFNIVSFGTHYTTMFRKSVVYKSETFQKALEMLATFSADMMETNILTPMKYIFRQPTTNQPRTIFLLTDGRVPDLAQVVTLITQNVSNSRVHTFGIGSDANVKSLKAVARAGRGTTSVVYRKDEVRIAVIRALSQAVQPTVTDLRFRMGGETIPKQENGYTVYFDETFTVFASLHNVMDENIEFSWWNVRKGCNERHKVRFEDLYVIHGDFIQKLWAKNKVAELETDIDRGVKMENSIIVLALQHKLCTDYTEYLTHDKLPGKDPSQDIKKPIQIITFYKEAPKDSEIIQYKPDIHLLRKYHLTSDNSSSLSSPTHQKDIKTRLFNRQTFKLRKLSYTEPPIISEYHSTIRTPSKPSISSDTMSKIKEIRSNKSMCHSELSGLDLSEDYLDILSMQDAEGFWSKVDIERFLQVPEMPEEVRRLEEPDIVWNTLQALKYLEKNFLREKAHWILAAQKSRRWLKNRGVTASLLSNLVW
jgi:uncharacterized protein YegL